jgi:outer membrane protein assembly factor BamE
MSLSKAASILAISACTLMFTGCETLRFPGVYRIDVPQGNKFSDSNIEKLRLGMSPQQVHYLMGTAAIKDIFSKNRWDYIYYLESGRNDKIVQSRLTLYFDNSLLVKVDKDQYISVDELKKQAEQKLQNN